MAFMYPTCWKRSMRITNVRYGRIVFISVATILILFMFLLAQFSLRASGGKGILDRAKQHFHHWFQKTVFKHNWEDIHCRRKHANETTVEESWIPELAKQLNLNDATSLFDSNTGCNEWLTLLRKKYPKMRIGGAHVNQYAVEYAKKLFNDTPSNFGTISSAGKLDFLRDTPKYAHAINYGGLRDLGDKNVQCNLVREMLRILMPGGSLYLGHNIEEKDCKVLDKYAKVAVPGCYWSETCLKNRTDIAAIYYIKEKDLFGAHSQIDECYTAVFIHKKVRLSRANDGLEEPPPKFEPHENMYICETDASSNIGTRLQAVAKRVLGKNLVFPGSFSTGIELAKKMSLQWKGNLSHTLS